MHGMMCRSGCPFRKECSAYEGRQHNNMIVCLSSLKDRMYGNYPEEGDFIQDTRSELECYDIADKVIEVLCTKCPYEKGCHREDEANDKQLCDCIRDNIVKILNGIYAPPEHPLEDAE